MNVPSVEDVANAVLYEGYILYPYRASAVKNRKRFNFGVAYPEAYSDAQPGGGASCFQTECLVIRNPGATLDVKLRFLHLIERSAAELLTQAPGLLGEKQQDFKVVETLDVNGRRYTSWQEAAEREVAISGCNLDQITERPLRREFSFPLDQSREALRDAGGKVAGLLIRSQQLISGAIEVSAEPAGEEILKLRLKTMNLSPLINMESDEEALLQSLISAHAILRVRGGEFVSLLDPPERLKSAAAGCQNAGTYPVLAGAEGAHDTVLSSPIILYDYPQIAPESAGDFFDGTEIDEMLALRVLTMTDGEKREMRDLDDRTRGILERTEALPPEHMLKLHGVLRSLRPVNREEAP